jgi:hypothetical protein
MPVTAVIERRVTTEASEAPAESLGSVTLPLDLSELLTGATEARTELHGAALVAAGVPRGVCKVTLCVTSHTFEAPAEAGVPPPADTPLATFLPPGLRDSLAPVVFRVHEIADLPDAPASRAQLDTACHSCRLRMRLPSTEEWLEEPLATGV